MNYAKEYLSMIESGQEIVSHKVHELYKRECNWMQHPPSDFPYYFDEKEACKHIDFIERFCKQSKGKYMGVPLKLEPFQKAKLSLVFGWRGIYTKYRRIRQVVDLRGRKCGKSTETAAVEWDVTLNDGEGGPETYCTSNKKEQSDIIFTECVNMRAQSPDLKAISKKRKSDIYIPYNMGLIKSLSIDTDTMDGFNPSFFSQDEFHAAKTSALYDVMIQGQSMREQPLAWLISTNGFVRNGFFDNTYTYASNVALWTPGYEDYTYLPIIYELDDRDTWKDESHWAEANPGLGHIKKIDTLRDFVKRAEKDASFLPTVLTKDFNVFQNTFQSWISYDAACNRTPIDMEYLKHSYAIGGCDLSSTTDLTCATLMIMKPNDSRIYVLQKYFLPQKRVEEVEQMSRSGGANGEAPYKIWADQGYLQVCPGATVDFHEVTEWFYQMVMQNDIRPLWIGYDAALSGYWAGEMANYGFEMEKIRQGPFTWTYPMKDLRGKFEDKLVIHGGNPMLEWCLQNTAVKSINENGIDSQQPVKSSSVKRIDGMVSLLNAYTCFKNHEEEFLGWLR